MAAIARSLNCPKFAALSSKLVIERIGIDSWRDEFSSPEDTNRVYYALHRVMRDSTRTLEMQCLILYTPSRSPEVKITNIYYSF